MSTKVKGDKIKEGSIPLSALEEMPFAYPVDTADGKENKVVGLGGDCQYGYIGELVASEFGTPTEEKIVGETIFTEYVYQPIYGGKYIDIFEYNYPEKYITLYIGNDVDGYTSNKVYISEDANNLTYYNFNFVGGFGPVSLEVAISPDLMVYCRNYRHHTNKNSKVFSPICKQQLDVNLIPQEIARKEDISLETIKSIKNYDDSYCMADVTNYVAENGNVTNGLCIMPGVELGSKVLNIINYVEGLSVQFQYKREDEDYFYYSSDVADIKIKKTSTILGPEPYNISIHSYHISTHKYVVNINEDTFDFSKEYRTMIKDNTFINNYGINIYSYCEGVYKTHSAFYVQGGVNGEYDVYGVYLKNKYIEFKIKYLGDKIVEGTNKYYRFCLELIKEIDILSLESRLAELEAKVSTL